MTGIEVDERRFGAAIKAARIAANLTQAALADRANLSVGAVSNLECGSSNVTTLLRVARVLGLTDAIVDAVQPTPTFSPLAVADQSEPPAKPRQRVRT